MVVYRRTYRGTLVSSFLNPVLFLAAMGVALGSLVDKGAGASRLGGVAYLSFVAPGLLAAFAMQTAAGEATFPVMGGIKWLRTFHGMLATPLGVGDLITGIFLWMSFRISVVAGAYVLVMAAFGVVSAPVGALLAIPAAVLTGMAFAAPIAAFSATQDNDQGFALIFRMIVMPLFLFSGTFFPVSQLPGALQPVSRLTPLWHGVELCRGLVLGSIDMRSIVGHVTYLVLFVVFGTAVARRTFARRLAS